MKKLPILFLLFCAALLYACARSGSAEEEQALTETEISPVGGQPEPEGPMDGGVIDNSDLDAPKTIGSDQIVAFDCWFSTVDLAEPGALGNHIYALQAKLENGAVKGTYQVRDTGEERAFRASHDLLNELQGLVETYDLAQYNGHSYTVSGLPGDYGARLEVRYASGESIYAYDNQDNFLSWGAMDGLLKLFERGAAAKFTQPVPLAVETGYGSEAFTDGTGEIRYPIYRIEGEDHAALSAALSELNELQLDSASGEMDEFRSAGRGQLFYRTDAFVTRADSEVVSFYERTERYEDAGWEEPVTEYAAHNLDTRTGRELAFSDVFRDREYLPELLLLEFEKSYPEQVFYDGALDVIRQSVESGDGSISFALSYGCVHILANEYVLNDEPGGQHITLSYVLDPDQVRAFYTAAPLRWILPADDGTTYWRTDTSHCFRIKSYTGADNDDVIWEVARDGMDEGAYVEPFYGYAPECWLACVDGRYFIYLRVPAGDVSLLTKIYEVSTTGVSQRIREPLAMAVRPGTPLDPEGLQMSLGDPVVTSALTLLPYGTFRIAADGLPEQTGDVYGLEGPWVRLREDGRYNPADPAEAAVSGGMWTLVAGERLRPYQTDRESWLDFITEDGRVVRFSIDRFSDEMRLDNFGTLDKVFVPEGDG